ncbi:MAG: adenylyl-sulfate kinase, partial [Kiritimatiellae bacterium]|nr:adenylyl-sulfate kinase [Kiritimatiellia bacterium]
NMATGASTCNLAIILVDARYGVLEQTRRHSFIASLLGIKHLVIAINKMDLVDYSEETFDRIRKEYEGFAAKLQATELYFLPMSALSGDNVVEPSENMPWFKGAPLLSYLETVPISGDRNLIDFRFPVQYVLRPDLDFRGFAGTIASGIARKGDEVMVLPSRKTTRIKSITTFKGELEEAYNPMAVALTLEDEVDVSRGDMLVSPNNAPHVTHDFDTVLVWMHDDELVVGKEYLLKCGTNVVPARVNEVKYRFDVNTLHRLDADTLNANDIGRVSISASRPIAFDSYTRNRGTGALVLIDRMSNSTMAAGMILERDAAVSAKGKAPEKPVSGNITEEASLVSADERRKVLGHGATTIWLTGLSGSGKSTIAKHLEKDLIAQGCAAFILDGDNVRHGLNRDLGFSAEERTENIRRVAEVAKLFNAAGIVVITSFISPYLSDRDEARKTIGDDNFIEIHVDTPLDVCESRDPKGLYKKARAGEIDRFTGISAPYEAPETPQLVLNTSELSVEESVKKVIEDLALRGIIKA